MDKNEFIEKLNKEIAKTERLVIEYKEMTQPIAPDVSLGRLTRMDAINNKSVVEAALRQAEEKLDKLNYVFNNLDSPSFGKCKKCGVEIPPARILIRPESIYCIKCAQ